MPLVGTVLRKEFHEALLARLRNHILSTRNLSTPPKNNDTFVDTYKILQSSFFYLKETNLNILERIILNLDNGGVKWNSAVIIS